MEVRLQLIVRGIIGFCLATIMLPVSAALAAPDIQVLAANSPLLMDEAGACDTLSVSLGEAPTADVDILAVQGPQLFLGAFSLTFTPANWSVPQPAMICAADDFIAETSPHSGGDIDFFVTSADPVYDGWVITSLSTSITDNDTAGVIVTESGGQSNVTEGSVSDTVDVVLASEPEADLTISFTQDAELTTAPTSLTFTTVNWNVPQTVTINGTNDGIPEGTDVRPLAIAVSSLDPFYDGISVSSVSVSVTDGVGGPVVPGVTVAHTGGSTDVSEAGTCDTVRVSLASLPTATVVVSIVSGAALSLNKSGLIYTTSNWYTPQAVQVCSTDNQSDDGVTYLEMIDFTVASSDLAYAGILVPSFAVDILDDDVASVEVGQTDGSTAVIEGVATDTVAITLGAEPLSDVTLTAVVGDDLSVSPSTLTFDHTNWTVPQIVTVTGIDDAIDEGADSENLRFDAAAIDPAFNSISSSTIGVAISDTPAAIEFEQTSGGAASFVDGGAAVNWRLRLSKEPTSDVTVTMDGSGELSSNPGSVTFTSSNWSSWVVVEISALQTAATGDRQGLLRATASSSDTDFNGISADSGLPLAISDPAPVTTTPVDTGADRQPADTTAPVLGWGAGSSDIAWNGGLSLAYVAADASGAVDAQVTTRTARWGRGFGKPSTRSLGSVRSALMDIPAGATSCASVIGVDGSSNRATLKEHCFAAPLDVVGMTYRNTHWLDTSSSSAVENGVLVSRKRKSQVTTPIRARQVGVVMERCSTCGVVEVLLNGKRIAKASTRGKARSRLVVRSDEFGQVKSGTLTIRRSSGGNIRLDAVIAWQA